MNEADKASVQANVVREWLKSLKSDDEEVQRAARTKLLMALGETFLKDNPPTDDSADEVDEFDLVHFGACLTAIIGSAWVMHKTWRPGMVAVWNNGLAPKLDLPDLDTDGAKAISAMFGLLLVGLRFVITSGQTPSADLTTQQRRNRLTHHSGQAVVSAIGCYATYRRWSRKE